MSQSPSDVERIKSASNYLRGTLAESLVDPITGAIAEDDTQLSKFHGIYQQDDRELRAERRKQKLEPAYSFMIRVRVPGGVCTPAQWLALDRLADEHANQTLRLTTRQAVQYHGVIKQDLKPTIQGINAVLMDTIAACGDVNRNVMCTPNPVESAAHQHVYGYAAKLSELLTPNTRAYHEIWLDGQRHTSTKEDVEPIYGETYLPRKFKAAIAIPPHNDVDIYTQDLGFIAVIEQGELLGFNVTVGGGMGMSHGEPETYPRLADTLGFCRPDQLNDVAVAVVTTQRDFGDRTNRKHARLKYTIDDRGIDWFRREVQTRCGFNLAPAREVNFTTRGDRYGWKQGADGRWHLTLFIENGRVSDQPGRTLKTGLTAIAKIHQGDFRLTANQNLIVADVPAEQKAAIDALASQHQLLASSASPLRRNAMACVAFPTCALAMAESERYLPELIGRVDQLIARHGLTEQEIVMRMTGCPNGCARPYAAEIGLVGKGPGKYNLYLGAEFTGTRLNKLYRENIAEPEILSVLDGLLGDYAARRAATETFGDFLVRTGQIAAVANGKDFHA